MDGCWSILLLFAIPPIMYMVREWCKKNELSNYNDGVCKHCGAQLRMFDADSQGNNLYSCSNRICDKENPQIISVYHSFLS